jgi:hypothetical protein
MIGISIDAAHGEIDLSDVQKTILSGSDLESLKQTWNHTTAKAGGLHLARIEYREGEKNRDK